MRTCLLVSLLVCWLSQLEAGKLDSNRSPRSYYDSSFGYPGSSPQTTNSYLNYITYSEIKNRLDVFPPNRPIEQASKRAQEQIQALSSIGDFKEIEVDANNEVVFVGARDYLVRLSFHNDSLKVLDLDKDVVNLEPSSDSISECKRSSAIKTRFCKNYVRVVKLDTDNSDNYVAPYASERGNRLLVCGTNAYKPTCTWRDTYHPKRVLETFDGLGKSPQSPESSLAYLRSDSDFYFATNIDFNEPGVRPDHLIERSLGQSKQLRTDQYNSNWLNEPTFVASLTIGDFVYFFIRETAIEYMNCGQKIYSRVIRMCKHDQGIDNQEIWRSFEKARLNCSINSISDVQQFSSNAYSPFGDGERSEHYPFYFDELVDVYHDKSKNLIYTLFSTQSNGVKGSAVCIYDQSSLEAAFRGPYKHQKTKDSVWEPYNEPVQMPKCESSSFSARQSYSSMNNATKYIDSQKFQLKHLSVQPLFKRPILVLPNQRILKLVVDSVVTKHQNTIDMLFLASEKNTLQKYMIINMDAHLSSALSSSHLPNVCHLEEIEVLESSSSPKGSINNLVLLKSRRDTSRNLLVATSSNLVRVPVANCEMQTNNLGCLALMDPYCVWDSKSQKCILIFKTNETANLIDSQYNSRFVSQSLKTNPHLHQNPINSCPTTNIPVDGGFSDWSPWTTCTTKSGERCKCRMRVCNSPEPRNGGKNCDENSAIEIQDCEVNGGWTEWSSWSSCSLIGSLASNCDPTLTQTPKAIRTRFRSCTNPAPRNNGRICVGSDQEEEMCTPEMINPCISYTNLNQWMSWGAWEECSKPCGEGFQMRRRLCNGKNCLGCNQEWRTCNSEPCKEKAEKTSEWETIEADKETNQKLEKRFKFVCKYDQYAFESNNNGFELNSTAEYRICENDKPCKNLKSLKELGQFEEWSEWSPCRECGDEQYRSRKCNSPNGCFGNDREIRTCLCKVEDVNEGWSCWSEFSECSATQCDTKGVQKRTRKCLRAPTAENPSSCSGMNEEIRTCYNSNCTNHLDAISDRLGFGRGHSLFHKSNFTLIHVIAASVTAFLLGSFIILLIIYFYFRPNSNQSGRLGSCCCCSKPRRPASKKFPHVTHHHLSGSGSASGSTSGTAEQHLSSSSDHNSETTETGLTDMLNLPTSSESSKTQYCMAPQTESSCPSSNSNHSKEYFTIGNRFDPVGLSSLLNDVIPDDDDDELNTTNMLGLGLTSTGTLGRNKSNKSTGLNLPNKSFNTYTNLKETLKNSKLIGSGANAANNTSTSNYSNGLTSGLSGLTAINLSSHTANSANASSNLNGNLSSLTTSQSGARYSNYGNLSGTLRSNKQRTSYAFPLRTNLDHDL